MNALLLNILTLYLNTPNMIGIDMAKFPLFAQYTILFDSAGWAETTTKTESSVDINIKKAKWRNRWEKFKGDGKYASEIIVKSIGEDSVLISLLTAKKKVEWRLESSPTKIIIFIGDQVPATTIPLRGEKLYKVPRKDFIENINILFSEGRYEKIIEWLLIHSQTAIGVERGLSFYYTGEALYRLSEARPQNRKSFLLRAARYSSIASHCTYCSEYKTSQHCIDSFELKKGKRVPQRVCKEFNECVKYEPCLDKGLRVEARLKASKYLRLAGFPYESAAQADIILSEFQNNISAKCLKGLASIDMNKIPEAMNIFLEINSENPDDVCGKIGLAEIYYEIGERDNSLKLFKEVGETQIRENPNTLLKYANLLLEYGDLISAKRIFTYLSGVFDEKIAARAMLGLANTYRKEGDMRKAIRQLYKVMELFNFSKEDFQARLEIVLYTIDNKIEKIYKPPRTGEAQGIPEEIIPKYIKLDPAENHYDNIENIAIRFIDGELGKRAIFVMCKKVLSDIRIHGIDSNTKSKISRFLSFLSMYHYQNMMPKIYPMLSECITDLTWEISEKLKDDFWASIVYLSAKKYFSFFSEDIDKYTSIANSLVSIGIKDEAETITDFMINFTENEKAFLPKLRSLKPEESIKFALKHLGRLKNKNERNRIILYASNELRKLNRCPEAVQLLNEYKLVSEINLLPKPLKKEVAYYYYLKGFCSFSIKQYDAAYKYLTESGEILREVAPKSEYLKSISYALPEIALANNDDKLAIKLYEKALKEYPDYTSSEIFAFKAFTIAEKNNDSQSSKIFKEFFSKRSEKLLKLSWLFYDVEKMIEKIKK